MPFLATYASYVSVLSKIPLIISRRRVTRRPHIHETGNPSAPFLEVWRLACQSYVFAHTFLSGVVKMFILCGPWNGRLLTNSPKSPARLPVKMLNQLTLFIRIFSSMSGLRYDSGCLIKKNVISNERAVWSITDPMYPIMAIRFLAPPPTRWFLLLEGEPKFAIRVTENMLISQENGVCHPWILCPIFPGVYRVDWSDGFRDR